jgi:glycosyltransferase involved in cell wall biosynthesis
MLSCGRTVCGFLRRPRRRIVVLGVESFRHKYLYQAKALSALGWDLDFFATNSFHVSVEPQEFARVIQLDTKFVARLLQIVSYLWKYHKCLHHAEIYVGGRFAALYCLLCRAFRIPTIVVERGDIQRFKSSHYGLATRASMLTAYRSANLVWYKEPYMARLLSGLGVRRTFMLPNAVPEPPVSYSEPVLDQKRDISFLWVNRIIRERNSDWLHEILPQLSRCFDYKMVILGAEVDPKSEDFDLSEKLFALSERVPSLQIYGHVDPNPWYSRALFFVLPANRVFGNFALLEAMSRGVVPIVTRAEGTDLIVQHGENGFVTEPSAAALKAAMRLALQMPRDDWCRLSSAARHTVATRFSLAAWVEKLLAEYERLDQYV